eukprot:gb/GEZN01006529.1/.p1 GENE.gb/GEZN01006529.1/~~gb/GEZN01006529.1/.p1  ORF type:complete len:481 (+),score=70.28 gb/GEZN01006529.1/:54-1445(+)
MAEIEPSKENIQPLKGGRDAVKLVKALRLQNDPVKQEGVLAKERAQHEAKIHLYSGEDPLSPWLDYIVWTRSSHTTAGTEAHHIQLLEKCTRNFKDDLKYRDDQRYLKVWIMYADAVPDPTEIFAFLKANKIGVTHALLYEAWAMALEDQGKVSKADKVLEYGIRKQAEPKARLQAAYTRFQKRAVQRIQKQQEAGRIESKSTAGPGLSSRNDRSFGNPLSTRDRAAVGTVQVVRGRGLGRAGVVRQTGAARPTPYSRPSVLPSSRLPYQGGPSLGLSQHMTNPSSNFTIFQDDPAAQVNPLEAEDEAAATTAQLLQDQQARTTGNVISNEASASTSEDSVSMPSVWPALAPTESKNKENSLKTTTWNDPLASMVSAQNDVISRVANQIPGTLRAKTSNTLLQAAGVVFVEPDFLEQDSAPPDVHSLAGRRHAQSAVLQEQTHTQREQDLAQNPLKHMASYVR